MRGQLKLCYVGLIMKSSLLCDRGQWTQTMFHCLHKQDPAKI